MTDERPWWHTEKVLPFGRKVRELPTPELRAIHEEIKGSVSSLQTQIETESPELQVVRDIARELGPSVAFDMTKFAEALAKRCEISVDDAEELVEDFDWWKRAKKALGHTKQKQGIVQGEIARRRAADAEQVVFDIKGKVMRAATLLEGVKTKSTMVLEARKLIVEARDHLQKVGP
jgi:hypothetical protein